MSFYNHTTIIILMLAGLYIVISDKNLIKKMMGISIFQSSIILFYISLGYVQSSLPPILNSSVNNVYTNPIPHVLMLTAIVVGIATFSVGLSLAIVIKEEYATTDVN